MKLLLFVFMMFNFIYSSTEILKNECLKISVSEDGSLGDGHTPPGIQFDKDCNSNFSNARDYLTPATPYEYYSLKYNTSTYYANNGVDRKAKKIIKGLKNFTINKNSSGIYTTAFTKDGKFKIEHKYSLEGKKLNITTKITNLTDDILQNIYFARGLDPDIDNVGDGGDATTENIRGYNGSNPNDFVYSKSVKSGSPIGLYSTSEVPHNTSLFTFDDNEKNSMDAEDFFNGVEKGNRVDDSIINIAFKIEQLQPNETKKLEYKYMCSSDIDKSVIIESLAMDGDKKVFQIIPTMSSEYKLIESIPSFKVSSQSISSVTFPLSVDNIPNGIQIKIDNKIFDKNNSSHEVSLDCNRVYTVDVLRNRDFDKEGQFSIGFKAGEIKDNVAQWFGNDEFTLKFKSKIVKGGIIPRNIILKPSTNRLSMPLNKLDGIIYFTVYANDKKIVGKELKELKFTTDLKLNNYKIEFKKDTIELKFIPQKSFCLPPNINIGENSVHFTITTPYPNETQTKSIEIEVKDIDFWAKWGCLILLSLGLLFLLILIYGYLKKNRFCKNSHFKIEREGRKASSSYFKSKVSFISKLIPFRDEKVSIEGITFVAGGGCRVIIPKSSQSKKLNINGDELEDTAGRRDITMVGGDEIFRRNKVMRFH